MRRGDRLEQRDRLVGEAHLVHRLRAAQHDHAVVSGEPACALQVLQRRLARAPLLLQHAEPAVRRRAARVAPQRGFEGLLRGLGLVLREMPHAAPGERLGGGGLHPCAP